MSDANAPQPADPAHNTLANLYGLGTPTPDPAGYDLPAPDALHPLTDIAALRSVCDRLAKRLDELTSAVMLDLGNISHQVEAQRTDIDGAVRIAATVEQKAAALERRLAALERAHKSLEHVAAHHADALQVLMLRGDDEGKR